MLMEKIKQFGIHVIRMIWPGGAKTGIHRLGILLLGLGMLIGVSQAGPIQSFIIASLSSDPIADTGGKTTKKVGITSEIKPKEIPGGDVADLGTGLAGAPTIVDLIGESQGIVRGKIQQVTDGFEKGLPYTEVKLQVTEAFRGRFSSEYTFRQFGLIEPRSMGNGKMNLNVTPAGWAKYSQGEDVVLFLYEPAPMTGLQTTSGLGQGKITLKNGSAESQFGNAGLFENVVADRSVSLNDRDKRVLATKKGAVNSDSFVSLVRKAVKGRWVEGGKLRNAKK